MSVQHLGTFLAHQMLRETFLAGTMRRSAVQMGPYEYKVIGMGKKEPYQPSSYRRVLGYLALVPQGKVVGVTDGVGKACIVLGSAEAMRQHLAKVEPASVHSAEIVATSFADVLRALHGGGAYAFDQQAYSHFYPLAKREKLDVKDVNFQDIKKQGFEFVTVRIEKGSS